MDHLASGGDQKFYQEVAQSNFEIVKKQEKWAQKSMNW